jgi:hypothetical protein
VTVHYDGMLSKRPGRQACTQRGAQDFADRWSEVDCSQCFVTLLGMPVISTGDATATGTIMDLVPGSDGSVTVQWSTPTSDGSDPEQQIEQADVAHFETAWRSGVA